MPEEQLGVQSRVGLGEEGQIASDAAGGTEEVPTEGGQVMHVHHHYA